MDNKFNLKFYSTTRKIVRVAFKGIFRPKINGLENIQNTGASLFIGNHRSLLDVPLLVTTVEEPIHLMAKQELFNIPVLAAFFSKMGAIPIDRNSKKNRIKAALMARRRLKNGCSVGIFPEATRNKYNKDLPFEPVAKLATVTNNKIIPFAISGKYRIGGGITISFGEPLENETLKKLDQDADYLVKRRVKSLQLYNTRQRKRVRF